MTKKIQKLKSKLSIEIVLKSQNPLKSPTIFTWQRESSNNKMHIGTNCDVKLRALKLH